MKNSIYHQTLIPMISLFTSFSTLICCALPALFVTLGMGAAVAGLISSAPWLTVISDYKFAIFVGAGTMLALSTLLQWKARNAPCPADPLKAKACARMRAVSWWILGISILIYVIGFFFTFLAADLLL